MFAAKIAFLATATCLLATKVQGEVSEEILNLVGLFPSSYDYAGRAFTGEKESENFLNEEDRLLIDMAEEGIEDKEGNERAVTTTLTATQMANALVAGTKAKISGMTWDVSKKFQNQYTDVPYKAGSQNVNMRVSLSSGTITGLGSLATEYAGLNNNTNTLSLRMGMRSVYVDSSYDVSVPKVDAAPANTVSGQVQDKLSHAWIDAQVKVDANGLPLNILSFNANSDDPLLTKTTNIAGNKYGPMYQTAFSEALRQITLNMMESNLKVMFNQALQDIKAAGSYSG